MRGLDPSPTLGVGAGEGALLVAEELAYQAKRDLTRAEAAYLKAVELNPNLVAAYVSLGQIYGASKEYDRAIGQLDKALATRPDQPAAR